MFEEPNNGDVIFFVYSCDISEHVLQKMILMQLTDTEYESLCLIDAATHRYTLRGMRDNRKEAAEKPEGDYDEITPKRIRSIVVSEE